MKKVVAIIVVVCVAVILIYHYIYVPGKPVIVEDVIVEFWYSNDGGVTYFQLPGYHRGWGYSFYMKLRVQVHTDSNRATFPTVSLYIGDSDNITAYVIGGAVVTPRIRMGNIIYDFTARAVQNNDKFTELFVEFIPHKPGVVEMEVEITHEGNKLDEFKISDAGINFMCICESISRDIFGDYRDWEPDWLDILRLSCNCEKQDCAFCFHD